MKNKAIVIRGLNKSYRLYNKPSEILKEILLRKPLHREFHALKDIDLEVPVGETLGVIGENGAGKSTLLKILARTLKPTSGELILNGKVSALLELGAGFNPELSGRENIFLNGYLIGMSKEELQQKEDEIIRFAEIGDFIDQPIKTYSSGMQVRLAFSIATSVDPDILVVDEALSVGDEYFQKKSIDRMMRFKREGKTIVFCSHLMYYILEICDRAIWLHNGKIASSGSPDTVVLEYQSYERSKTAQLKVNTEKMVDTARLKTKNLITIQNIRVTDLKGHSKNVFKTFDGVEISFLISNRGSEVSGHAGFAILRNDEVMVFGTSTAIDQLPPFKIVDQTEINLKIPSLALLPGIYNLMLIVADENALYPYDVNREFNITIEPNQKEYGIYYIEHQWSIKL